MGRHGGSAVAASPEELCLVGIRRGGVPLAERLAEALAPKLGQRPQVGAVDISLYRDDAAAALPDPKIGPSEIPFEVDGKELVLIDDVLQTGRTIRAAIDCVLDYGRPRRIWLAVALDRGGRELPIAPDFAAEVVEVQRERRLRVELLEGDRMVVRLEGARQGGEG